MRIRILEGHVNYPLLRGAGAGVFMLVGAAYDGRRSLFLGSPAAPLDGTQRRLIVPSLLSERASPKAPPPKKKSEKKKKKKKKNSAHLPTEKIRGHFQRQAVHRERNDGLFSKGGFFLITQHTALPLLFLERESRVSVS